MSEQVFGLKIEDDVLYCLESNDGEWTEAPTSHISRLESLLSYLRTCKYSSRSIKTNEILESSRDAGDISVRSYKDEDGDFTLNCQIKAQPKETALDEDVAFGLPPSAAKNTTKAEKTPAEAANPWTKKKDTKRPDDGLGAPKISKVSAPPKPAAVHELEKAVKNVNIKSCDAQNDTSRSVASQKVKAPAKGARKTVSGANAHDVFKKRKQPDANGSNGAAKRQFMSALLRNNTALKACKKEMLNDNLEAVAYKSPGFRSSNPYLDGWFYITLIKSSKEKDAVTAGFALERTHEEPFCRECRIPK